MKKVFISAGHGGNDPGAVANGYKEEDLALKIALANGAYLESKGVSVRYSRKCDENDPLEDEIRECNAFSPDLAVSEHINAGGGEGFEVFCSISGGLGRTLAISVENEIKALNYKSRGVKTRKSEKTGRDYYGFIRGTNCPAIIIESGFIDNKKDLNGFDEDKELKAIGIAHAKAILKTLGIKDNGAVTPDPTPSKPEPNPVAPKPKKELWEISIQGQEVIDLQKALGVKADGKFGSITLKACPILRRGSKGNVVKLLQKRLLNRGYSLPKFGADSDYGTETCNAIKKLQDCFGLVQDEITGENTWKAAYGLDKGRF